MHFSKKYHWWSIKHAIFFCPFLMLQFKNHTKCFFSKHFKMPTWTKAIKLLCALPRVLSLRRSAHLMDFYWQEGSFIQHHSSAKKNVQFLQPSKQTHQTFGQFVHHQFTRHCIVLINKVVNLIRSIFWNDHYILIANMTARKCIRHQHCIARATDKKSVESTQNGVDMVDWQ